MDFLTEPRGSYSGSAEVWSNGSKLFDVKVTLTGYVTVVPIAMIANEAERDYTTSWDGILLRGIPTTDQAMLPLGVVELRLPSGKVGYVVFDNNEGSLKGVGWPPFPITYNGVEVNDESEITE